MNTEIVGNRYGKWTVLEVFKDGRFWMSRSSCACGKIKTHRVHVLTKGESLSCPSCRDKSSWARKNPSPLTDENAFTKVYGSYRSKAVKRNLTFNLTRYVTKYLMTQNCFYCGDNPSNVVPPPPDRKGLEFKYNGIDRIDSNRGYEIGNVLPCCKYCNIMKSDLTFEEFIGRIMKIGARWKSVSELKEEAEKVTQLVRNIYVA